MTALHTTREVLVSREDTDISDSEGELNTLPFHSTLPAMQTSLLAEVVSKMAEVTSSSNYIPSKTQSVADATYIAPGLEVLHFPELLNTHDGFVISGQAWGSEITGEFVQVSIAGVKRNAKITDGLWDVFFEDGALPRYQHGTCELTAVIRDTHGSAARTSIMVTLEQFAEGYVQIDEAYSILETEDGDMLCASGELALGTHDQDRDLAIQLLHDKTHEFADKTDNIDNPIAATGIIKSGWQFGEWRAQIPLHDLRQGDYYVRALLLDRANPALTHIATASSPITI